mmetsp:Transcript_69054/g.218395  ORF Transcript_69054/g.218395 Transcript_69054/m.218395 type:complete len:110 (-) Transcript_69054:958-1287(-)
MNCEVTNVPLLDVENHQIREVLRSILHTILFSRALGLVQPKDVDSELFNLTYVQCGEKDVERKVEDRINCFCDWVEKHPGVTRGEVSGPGCLWAPPRACLDKSWASSTP